MKRLRFSKDNTYFIPTRIYLCLSYTSPYINRLLQRDLTPTSQFLMGIIPLFSVGNSQYMVYLSVFLSTRNQIRSKSSCKNALVISRSMLLIKTRKSNHSWMVRNGMFLLRCFYILQNEVPKQRYQRTNISQKLQCKCYKWNIHIIKGDKRVSVK